METGEPLVLSTDDESMTLGALADRLSLSGAEVYEALRALAGRREPADGSGLTGAEVSLLARAIDRQLAERAARDVFIAQTRGTLDRALRHIAKLSQLDAGAHRSG